ncbi:MAG: restriction endonuclease subunit S [Oxalobacter sp.]
MRAMKDSGVEWVGQIPDGWSVLPVRVLFNERKNLNKSGAEQNLLSLSYGNIIRKNINTNEGLLPASFNTYNIVEKGDIVFRLTDLQNDKRSLRTGLCKEHGIITAAYVTICPVRKVIPAYFHYLFHVYDQCKVYYNMGNGVRQGLNYSALSKLLAIVPPLSEQAAIANYLDTQCSRIDSIISKEEQVIEKLKEYKQSVITEAVTKGLNPDVPMKDSGIEWIGQIPEGWGLSKIKHVTRFSPPVDFNVDQDTEIGYLPMECLKNGNMTPYAKGLGQLTQSLTPFQNGDLVVAKVTPCFENGNIAIADGLASGVGLGTSEIFVFRCSGINTAYLFYVFRNDSFKALCVSSMTGTGGLKRIPSEFIRNIDIPLPKENEQTAIANYLDKKCAEIDRMIEKKQQLIEKLGEYKKSLIYEMVTGKKEVPLC